MAEERRGDPASKSPRDKPTGGKFHAHMYSIDAKGVRRSKAIKRTLRKAPPKKRSPTDAEREVVASGKAQFNERGRKALREESIGTKLKSFGRGLKRKITGRKAANRGSRKSGR